MQVGLTGGVQLLIRSQYKRLRGWRRRPWTAGSSPSKVTTRNAAKTRPAVWMRNEQWDGTGQARDAVATGAMRK